MRVVKSIILFITFKLLEKLLITVILLVSILSCSKKKIVSDEGLLGLEYYPTAAGRFIVYDVDSTVYSDLPVDTFSYIYRIKEKIADSFIDNEGQPAIRLERYIKYFNPKLAYDSMPWIIKEIWLANANKKSVQVVESNVRYTKLVFPIEEKGSWDGNANNTKGRWLYSYDYINRKETINKQTLYNVLLIKQQENKTLISYQYYTEKYAKGIGLVQREITDILSNKIVGGVPIEKRIETGIIYKQTLLTYGYE